MNWKSAAMGVAFGLLAVWLANNVGFVSGIVGPKK